jgi:hypothetical protein
VFCIQSETVIGKVKDDVASFLQTIVPLSGIFIASYITPSFPINSILYHNVIQVLQYSKKCQTAQLVIYKIEDESQQYIHL